MQAEALQRAPWAQAWGSQPAGPGAAMCPTFVTGAQGQVYLAAAPAGAAAAAPGAAKQFGFVPQPLLQPVGSSDISADTPAGALPSPASSDSGSQASEQQLQCLPGATPAAPAPPPHAGFDAAGADLDDVSDDDDDDELLLQQQQQQPTSSAGGLNMH